MVAENNIKQILYTSPKGRMRIVESVEYTPDGEKTFEICESVPGVALFIPDKDNPGNWIVNREKRVLAGGYVYKFLGGKIAETIDEYISKKSKILHYAKIAGVKEAKEELGLEINPLFMQYIDRSSTYTRFDLDIYFFLAHTYQIGV